MGRTVTFLTEKKKKIVTQYLMFQELFTQLNMEHKLEKENKLEC